MCVCNTHTYPINKHTEIWYWRHICPLYQEAGIQTPASTSHDLWTPVTPAPRDVMPHL